MATLYDALGTDPAASDDDLKRAYRQKCLETHPDRGGNDEAFRQVHRAWLVLCDPARRKTYDQTGRVDEPEPDNAGSHVHDILASLFMGLLDTMAANNADPACNDLVKCMKNALGHKIKELQTKRQLAQDKIDLCAFAATRFSEPQLEQIRQWAMERATCEENGIAKAIALHEEAMQVILKCQYRLPPVQKSAALSRSVFAGWSTTGPTGRTT